VSKLMASVQFYNCYVPKVWPEPTPPADSYYHCDGSDAGLNEVNNTYTRVLKVMAGTGFSQQNSKTSSSGSLLLNAASTISSCALLQLPPLALACALRLGPLTDNSRWRTVPMR
jgi:hypothetical protein